METEEPPPDIFSEHIATIGEGLFQSDIGIELTDDITIDYSSWTNQYNPLDFEKKDYIGNELDEDDEEDDEKWYELDFIYDE